MSASQVLDAKRSHWGIENQLHWVLDMQFREDESRARAANSDENFNVLRHWAYNLLKSETSMRGSFSDWSMNVILKCSAAAGCCFTSPRAMTLRFTTTATACS